ncbi:LysR family transcriptional regulator [Xanthobacter sp. TB0139]|uniref:LysR family transcriptional regulator n=1 Tax=Xanthobacter sp. TB0139 TaxID=3459178 RepID=UPI004039DC0F
MPRPDAITLRQLRALVAVTQTGSIAAAAEKMGLTPPAVHAQIRGLETALTVPLLQRAEHGNGSAPTAEAAPVLEAARRIDIALAACVTQVSALKAGHAGHVTLGMVSTAKYFVPGLVAQLKQSLPGIEVALVEANRGGIIADLQRQAMDLAIMGRPPRQPLVASTVIGPHPHGFIAPPDHPLAGRKLTVADLFNYPLVTREEGSGTRILMTRYLESQAEGRPYALTVLGSNETIKQAVMAGLGLAFLSLHTVTDELQSGRLVALDVPGMPLIRQWFLVNPAAARLSAAAIMVQAQIEKMGGSFLPELPAGILLRPGR